MKHATILIFCFAGISISFAQQENSKSVKQLENGVLIYEAKGVENNVPAAIHSNPVRTIYDWNLAECIDALKYIEEKINALHPEADQYSELVNGYQIDKAKIESRKAILSKP